MCGATIAATAEAPPIRKGRGRELLRLGLLAAALLIGFVPVLRFIGSMLWFHNFLGDYQVFWGLARRRWRGSMAITASRTQSRHCS